MFIPKRIIFEKDSLKYDMGKRIYDEFKDNKNIEIIKLTSNKVKCNIPGEDLYTFYREGKKTLVVGVKKGLKFQSCKPSANYQLPLISGCIGQCQYCYLNTQLGDRPFIKVNVNIDDILNQAQKYINERLPETTIFEGSATSDPVPVEPYTNSLKKTIEFFGNSNNGKFRFVTKYADIDNFLNIKHNGNTEIRFTLNTDKVIKEYEKGVASLESRVEGSKKLMEAGYPVGFIIAPVFLYENWQEDYKNLFQKLKEKIPKNLAYPIFFEVISHRYTKRAKNIIEEVFPENTLPMDDEKRSYRYGQFGYGKFTYSKEELQNMKDFFEKEINDTFDKCIIKYII